MRHGNRTARVYGRDNGDTDAGGSGHDCSSRSRICGVQGDVPENVGRRSALGSDGVYVHLPGISELNPPVAHLHRLVLVGSGFLLNLP